jgi:hypothetical protein
MKAHFLRCTARTFRPNRPQILTVDTHHMAEPMTLPAHPPFLFCIHSCGPHEPAATIAHHTIASLLLYLRQQCFFAVFPTCLSAAAVRFQLRIEQNIPQIGAVLAPCQAMCAAHNAAAAAGQVSADSPHNLTSRPEGCKQAQLPTVSRPNNVTGKVHARLAR